MLRAVASIYVEGQTLVRRDVFKLFRACAYSSSSPAEQIVLSSDAIRHSPSARTRCSSKADFGGTGSAGGSEKKGNTESSSPPPQPSPNPGSQRVWSALAAFAITVSLGGAYLYKKRNDNELGEAQIINDGPIEKRKETKNIAIPPTAASLPTHVQYLLVGAGTASFAAMRAIRSARPEAQVLMVGEEAALPYMRPPLSKELWREKDLPARFDHPDDISFRQWNGRRRSLLYEPNAFYTAADKLSEGEAGAGVARGWRVMSIDPSAHSAVLSNLDTDESHVLTYDKCLIATGVRARRIPALRTAAAAGRSLQLRSVHDTARLAAAVDDPAVKDVAVVGGGFLASELSAALADRLRPEGKRVMQVFRESAPLEGVLPHYLAAEAARRLEEAGVTLVPSEEVVDSAVDESGRVSLRLSSGATLGANVVAECAGSEPATELAVASGLELHPELGGVLVDAELRARSDLFAAGDVACFYDVALGRRRVEHHDHAVVSGRLAGENMAGVKPPQHYKHQSMFWSDLGPQLGYEAIGIIDSELRTVGVFSADAVKEQSSESRSLGAADAADDKLESGEGAKSDSAPKRYDRGVVFYLREKRVVGVLLWNLFNRLHVARQVLAQGEFDDLFEVAKLFTLNDEE
ncbi:apoptosis-inducing factor 1, mitochondrial-like [Danaus plexippus]|uniref:apoptosis-inducing factor 1, mitochondrial-like n=1 Tax=Danaus plexippus TaxID=13037 RepID=UPI002AAFCF01|nr:apoptosis-inducing factor 1, mitochondrial-like [Danaus plexippus]